MQRVVLSYTKYILIRVRVNIFKNYLTMKTHVIRKITQIRNH